MATYQVFSTNELKTEWEHYCEWVHPYDIQAREKLRSDIKLSYHWMMAFQFGYDKRDHTA